MTRSRSTPPAAILIALLLAAPPIAAQDAVDARLAGRVPPEVAAVVRELAAAAAARGLPIDPLVQKAIEGAAKGVPADRVTAALRVVAAQLEAAAGALREGGLAQADTEAIAAGAFGLHAGLGREDIARLARADGPVAVALRVAGTLTAMGVPAGDAVALVIAVLVAGRAPGDLVALPARLQAEIGRGATPAQAAAGLTRAADAGGRGRGAPPVRPAPPARPAHPPHPPHPSQP